MANAPWQTLSATALPVVLGAAALTAALILALFPLLRRYALARPNARSSHTIPTPQGGGIAVIAATLVTFSAAYAIGGNALASSQLLAVIAATVGLALLGMTDDIRPLAAGLRLAVQALAVALVVATLPDDVRIVSAVPLAIERAAIAVGLVWFVNLVNFMDGIDWMSVAEIVPVTGGLAVNVASNKLDLGQAKLSSDLSSLDASGTLPAVTVADTRNSNPGWSLTATASNFAASEGLTLDGKYLGIGKTRVVSASTGQSLSLGAGVAPGVGFTGGTTLASAAAGAGQGTATFEADVQLKAPAATTPGDYVSVVTVTVA